MPPEFWAEVHGAVVHFPIALTCFAWFCDAAVIVCWSRSVAAPLRVAGRCALGVGALSGLPAVVSGLVLTRGVLFGHGAVRWHHVFVWPSFGLLVATAVWSLLTPAPPTRGVQLRRVAVLGVLVGLMSATGYWGGRLALAFP
ncbi:MAG: DUF2231 domain-containing protein [Opitutales bacterium]